MKTTLSIELKNTPWDASQVPCSVSDRLNRDQSLSVYYIVLLDNIGDENLLRIDVYIDQEDRT